MAEKNDAGLLQKIRGGAGRSLVSTVLAALLAGGAAGCGEKKPFPAQNRPDAGPGQELPAYQTDRYDWNNIADWKKVFTDWDWVEGTDVEKQFRARYIANNGVEGSPVELENVTSYIVDLDVQLKDLIDDSQFYLPMTITEFENDYGRVDELPQFEEARRLLQDLGMRLILLEQGLPLDNQYMPDAARDVNAAVWALNDDTEQSGPRLEASPAIAYQVALGRKNEGTSFMLLGVREGLSASGGSSGRDRVMGFYGNALDDLVDAYIDRANTGFGG